MPAKVVTTIGTRPEAIKMAPVVRALAARPADFEQVVVATAQHRELLDQTLGAFDIAPDVDLDLMGADQRLDAFAASALIAVGRLLDELQPDFVLVQGDTTTVMATGLAAFYRGIRLGHVEAGLRSHALRSPFPEELNRRIAALAATYHFAPTARARENLMREGVDETSIHVTGNTIVDALRTMRFPEVFASAELGSVDFDRYRTILVTAHRRESHGAPLREVFRALRTLVARFGDVQIVLPVHLNPTVARTAADELGDVERIRLVEPLDHPDLLLALSRSCFVMTDSGGIQEEAPSLGKRVVVLREVTERPELIEAGLGELAGTGHDAIVAAATRLLTAESLAWDGDNPFGDGHAATRIADALAADVSRGPASAARRAEQTDARRPGLKTAPGV